MAENDVLDTLEIRETLTLREQERFVANELDTEPIQILSADPTDSERNEAIRDLQRRQASVQGVELLGEPIVFPPPNP